MATPRICSIPDCGKRHSGLGYCTTHLHRFRLYGDPTAGGTFRGAAAKWLADHQFYEGDDCLSWPFGAHEKGRGGVRFNGVPMGAHRAMCIIAHGPAPIGRNEAAHSCGNGHLGCVNPRHIRWSSSKENRADASRHGTIRGERAPTAILTETDVRSIRMMKGKLTHGEIAAQYGVARETIAGLLAGRTWAWLP